MRGTARRFRVRGRVQGVGFRWWTRQRAEALGLCGTVRNCEDGSVEILVAGPPEAVAELESALAHGPTSARVQALESEAADPAVVGDGFRIVH